MGSANQKWFNRDTRHAGWISLGPTTAWVGLLQWQMRFLNPAFHLWMYFLIPASMGFVAVAALNWRRWHSFRESIAASLLGVLYACAGLWIIASLALLFLSVKENVPLLFLVGLVFYTFYGVIYSFVPAVTCLGFAGLGGAILYGLLEVMRFVGKGRRPGRGREELRPRPLRMVA